MGKAIGCLLSRIETLEGELRRLRGEPVPTVRDCPTCAAGELCCEEHRHLVKEPS